MVAHCLVVAVRGQLAEERRRCQSGLQKEREGERDFFIDNHLVRIRFVNEEVLADRHPPPRTDLIIITVERANVCGC